MDFERQLELRAVIAGVVREVLETGAGNLRLSGGIWVGRTDQDPAPGELAVAGRIRSSRATACKVWRATQQSLPSGAWSEVSFDTALFDQGAWWSLANPGALRVPLAGVYAVGATVGFAGRAGGGRLLTLVSNGGAAWHTVSSQTGGSGADVYMAAHAVMALREGDSLHLWAYHDTGTPLPLLTSRESFPVLWAARMA